MFILNNEPFLSIAIINMHGDANLSTVDEYLKSYLDKLGLDGAWVKQTSVTGEGISHLGVEGDLGIAILGKNIVSHESYVYTKPHLDANSERSILIVTTIKNGIEHKD